MIDLIKACTDLGTHVCGAEFGPEVLMNGVSHPHIHQIDTVQKPKGEKELLKDNKRKNIQSINVFNEELYKTVQKAIIGNYFPIVVGGDHSLAIASALASASVYQNLGIIWVDAHADYNTFETTITGNIHGLPFATITGQVPEGLTDFHKGSFISPKKAVLVGARSIDYPLEMENLKKSGVHLFLAEDVERLGIDNVMQEAFRIASSGTAGIHVSLDVDVINPKEAPGVSIPEEGGFTKEEFDKAVDAVIQHKDMVKSLDLVEFNPSFDQQKMTYSFVKKELIKLLEAF